MRRASVDIAQGDLPQARAQARDAADETALLLSAIAALKQCSAGCAETEGTAAANNSEARRDAEWESFANLSRRLDELEIRLRERSDPDDAALKSALKELEARLQAVARRRGPAMKPSSNPPGAFAADISVAEAAAAPAGAPGQDPVLTTSKEASFPFRSGLLSRLNSAAQGATGANPVRRPSDAPVLIDTQNHIAELARKLDNMCRGATHLPPHRSEGVRDAEVEHVREDAQDALPPNAVAALETAISALNARVETLRDEDTRPNSPERFDRLARDFQASIARIDQPSPIERMEREIKALSERLNDLGKPGIDPAAFTRMQRQTEEIRESLAALAARPSPTDKIERQVAKLAESLGSQSRGGPDQGRESFGEVTNEILTLLKDPARAAALQALEARLNALTSKAEEAIARTNDPSQFDALSRHIEATQRQLTARFEAGLTAASNETGALKELVGSLAEKMGAGRERNPMNLAVEALEREMAKVVERLDRADKGFASLTALEQSIAALFAQIEETRRTACEAAEAARTAAGDRAAETGAHGGDRRANSVDHEPAVAREIAELRASQEEADRRIHLTLTAVQETVGKVADRLAKLETDLGEMRPSHLGPLLGPGLAPIFAPRRDNFSQTDAARAGALKQGDPAATGAPGRDGVAAAEAFSTGNAPAHGVRIAEAADYLIEPGSGLPQRRRQKSEPRAGATLAHGLDGNGGGRADFIAAARRAAQAAQMAASEATNPLQDPAVEGAAETDHGLLRQTRRFYRAHKRPLLLSLTALFLAIGVYAVARTLADRPANDIAPAFLKLLGKGLVRGDTAPGPESKAPANDPPIASAARSPIAQNAIPGLLDPFGLEPPQALAPISGAAPSGDATPARKAIAGSAPIVAGALGRSDAARRDAAAANLAGASSTNPMLATSSPPNSPATVAAAAPYPPQAPAARQPTAASEDPRDSAEAGDAAAQFELALRFAEGRERPRDLQQAARWYERAAQQGFAAAQYRLAVLYEKGLGVARDLAQAEILYRAAAEQGNTRAMHNLGVLAADGANGRPDYQTAAFWFGKAAEFGVRDSQFNLAVLFSRGLGVPQDLARSYAWFAIVAADGDAEAIRKRDDVGAKLAAADLAAAKTSAEAFRPLPAIQAANEPDSAQAGVNAAGSPATPNAVRPKVSGL
ncbi:tetratricopeptide repeat protein [Methylocapsa aurea]|uniref:tetratricopeptide repeat protein n=1 Tax=Methylocapsa aurea TaxID=663610 RepID=UPI000A5F42BC|nr:tetratricopeptide repeat protein [Methylocapsa aurea]